MSDARYFSPVNAQKKPPQAVAERRADSAGAEGGGWSYSLRLLPYRGQQYPLSLKKTVRVPYMH
ncbi:MAG: hypothetical protein RSD57_19780 [Comamonas sp.]